MRKYLIGMLALISFACLPGLTGCGAQDPLTAAERAWLEKKGVLNIGAFDGYPPFGFVGETCQPLGMSIDYWNLVAQKLDLKIKFQPAPFEKQIKGLESGEFDSLAGIFPLPEREKDFDFTKSFYNINTYLFVSPKLGGIDSLQNLPSLPVGVVEGDSSQEEAKKANLKTEVFSGYLETVMALAEGKVQAIILDEPVVVYYTKLKGLEGKIRKVPQPVAQGRMTLPVKKGNAQLLGILNKGVSLVSPVEWREIEGKWLGLVPVKKD